MCVLHLLHFCDFKPVYLRLSSSHVIACTAAHGYDDAAAADDLSQRWLAATDALFNAACCSAISKCVQAAVPPANTCPVMLLCFPGSDVRV